MEHPLIQPAMWVIGAGIVITSIRSLTEMIRTVQARRNGGDHVDILHRIDRNMARLLLLTEIQMGLRPNTEDSE